MHKVDVPLIYIQTYDTYRCVHSYTTSLLLHVYVPQSYHPPTNGSEDDGVDKSGGMIFPWGIFTMVVFSQLIPYMIKSVSDILTNVTYL